MPYVIAHGGQSLFRNHTVKYNYDLFLAIHLQNLLKPRKHTLTLEKFN